MGRGNLSFSELGGGGVSVFWNFVERGVPVFMKLGGGGSQFFRFRWGEAPQFGDRVPSAPPLGSVVKHPDFNDFRTAQLKNPYFNDFRRRFSNFRRIQLTKYS